MPSLPEVEQKFDADITAYMAAMDEIIAKAEAVAAAVRDAADAFAAIDRAAADAGAVVAGVAGVMARSLGDVERAANDAAQGISDIGRAEAGAVGDTAALEAGIASLDGKLDDLIGHAAATTGAIDAVGEAIDALAFKSVAAAATTRAATGVIMGGWRITGTMVHWALAGSAELLAVLIPAAIAAGAWAAVWVQGAGDVYERMTAVYDATEALGTANNKTAGQVVGLGNALQKAQNIADPQVFEALGGAIRIVKESTGGLIQVGSDVGIVFDKFLANLVLEFGKGGQAAGTMHALLKDMEPDLIRVGEFFGNLGHGIASFASQMPGLAEVMLHLLEVLARGADDLINFAAKLHVGSWSILTLAMAFEEFNRWGGLFITLLGKMGLATTPITGGFFSMERAMGTLRAIAQVLPLALGGVLQALGVMVGRFAGVVPAAEGAGTALVTMGGKMKVAALELDAFSGGALLAIGAGLAYLIYHFTAGSDAAQKYANSIQNAVKASEGSLGAFGAISAQFSKVQSNATQAAHALNNMGLGGMANQIRGPVTAAMGQLTHDTLNAAQGAQYLASKYHISLPQAMALAQQAGVDLTQSILGTGKAARQAQQQIADLVQGMAAMSGGSGQIAGDINALGIQSALAATKVGTLNQAWDAFMQGVTGGTGGLAQFQQSLVNIGIVIGHTKNNLGEATVKLNATGKQFAQDLTSYTGKGAQAWTNFDQIVGSTMPQLADWFRTAGAEGAISGKNISKAILDMAAEMVPFVSKSKTAQAELLAFVQAQGDNIKTMPQLEDAIKRTGAGEKNLASLTNQTTIAMGNLSKIAQNMSGVMNSIVTASIANAALKTYGYQAKVDALTQAIRIYGANSPKAVAAARAVTAAWDAAQKMAAQVAKQAQNAQTAIDAMHGKSIAIDVTTNYAYTHSGSPGGPGGGPQPHAASGGYVKGPGTSTSDSVAARLSHGEFVMSAAAVHHYGREVFDAMNARRMAGGGSVSPAPALTGGPGGSTVQMLNLRTEIMLDGSRIGGQQRTQTLIYSRRNPANNLSLRVR